MNPARTMIALVTASLLASCAPANSGGAQFAAQLAGTNERPNAVQGTATGEASGRLEGSTLKLNVTFTGLSANAAAGHIHGPASKDAAAPVLFPFKNVPAATAGNFSETMVLSEAQLKDLRDGKYYVNIHTSNNPGGELRGQLELR